MSKNVVKVPIPVVEYINHVKETNQSFYQAFHGNNISNTDIQHWLGFPDENDPGNYNHQQIMAQALLNQIEIIPDTIVVPKYVLIYSVKNNNASVETLYIQKYKKQRIIRKKWVNKGRLFDPANNKEFQLTKDEYLSFDPLAEKTATIIQIKNNRKI